MTDKIHVEAQLLRLLAAFPSFKMPDTTRGLYVEKLSRTEPDDFGSAVESFIEAGKKFPTIGDLIERAAKFRSLRLKRLSEQRESAWERSGATRRPDWGERFNTPKFYDAFERGQQRIKDKGPSSLYACPCMECQFRRLDGTLMDDGPVEEHLREAHATLGRP